MEMRPRRSGEVLDDAIRLARFGFWRIAPIVVFGSIPPALLAYFVVVSVGGDGSSSSTIIGAIVVMAVLLPFSILLLSGASMIDLYSIAMGQPITRRDSLRRTIRRVPALFVHLIVLLIVQTMAQAAVNMVAFLPVTAASFVLARVPILGGILLVISMIAIYVLQFAILGRFIMGIPSVVIDKTGPMTAISRSFRLTEGQTWANGFVLLYASLLSVALAFVVVTPFALVFSVVLPSSITGVALIVGYTAVGLAGYTFFSALLVVLFINGRVRSEGLDLQLIADELGFADPGPFIPQWVPQPGMFIPAALFVPPPGAPSPWTGPESQ
jgi:hypothetical protein